MVDLCCGSTSGLVAAVRLGHSAAGFNLSEMQVDASKRRLQQLSLKEVILSQPSQCRVSIPAMLLRTFMFTGFAQNMLSSLQFRRNVNKGFCEPTFSQPILKSVVLKHEQGTLRTHMFTGLTKKTLSSLQCGSHMFNRWTYMQMRGHSAHKKAANLAALKGDSPHEAQAAQEASVPDSPAGSQDVDGDEGDQDPEYREGDEGQERDEGSEAEYDEEGRSDMEAEFDDAEVFGDND